jgi:hypothetical protein
MMLADQPVHDDAIVRKSTTASDRSIKQQDTIEPGRDKVCQSERMKVTLRITLYPFTLPLSMVTS